MSSFSKRYRITDNISDKVMFEGSTNEIASILSISPSRICEAARDGTTLCRGRYRIEDITVDIGKTLSSADVSTAKAWDDFITPIREAYGIPVYRPGKGEKK